MLRNQRHKRQRNCRLAELHMFVQQIKGTLGLTVNRFVATCLQIAASGNVLFLKTKESEDQSLIHLNFSNIEKGEKKPLLLQYGDRY